MLSVSRTPEGIVVRRIEPHGETAAYRKGEDGSLCRQAGHRGPWVVVADFPADVWEALGAAPEAAPSPDRQIAAHREIMTAMWGEGWDRPKERDARDGDAEGDR